MILKLKDISCNPYRDLKFNPLVEAKIAELMASIQTTGYWENVVCRKNKDTGKYEIACGGHHRLEAAKRSGIVEASFIIKDFTDAQMLQAMDAENREVYASSPNSLIESVRAVVNALATNSISLPSVFPEKKNGCKGGVFGLRYAPSYVPANYSPEEDEKQDKNKAYTPLAIARFLGRVISKGPGEEQPARAIDAALDYLCLEELGKINSSVLVKDGKPISSTQLARVASDIKQRHVAEVVRRDKTAAEIAEYNTQQSALKAKAKADAEAAEVERRATLQKIADAKRKEQEDKADALKAKQKENDERAKAKDALNKQRMKELDEKIAQKKAWESEQRVIDAYMPIRRDVEALISRWEKKVSERDDEREQVKALAKLRDLRPEDRLRLRKAAVAVADHYNEWIAPQFAPLPTVKEELKTMAKREVAKRKSEKEKV